MKFFSKIIFICNCCFIAVVILHFIELGNKIKGKADTLIPLPFIESTIATLGYLAIIINILFCITAIIFWATKKINLIPKWMVIFNIIILLAQFYWFFLDNSK